MVRFILCGRQILWGFGREQTPRQSMLRRFPLPVAILIADQGADTAFSSMTEERWLRSYAGRDLEICAETGEPVWERRFESATRRLSREFSLNLLPPSLRTFSSTRGIGRRADIVRADRLLSGSRPPPLATHAAVNRPKKFKRKAFLRVEWINEWAWRIFDSMIAFP